MTDQQLMVTVDCYAGYRGEETPRRFYTGDRALDVVAVVHRWQTPDYRYFKIGTSADEMYTLRQDVRSHMWERI